MVVGDLGDSAAVDQAVAGADAVISALGPDLSRKATGLPPVDGTNNIVAVMQQHGVRRYVGLATPSVLDARKNPPGRPGSQPSWPRRCCAAPRTSSSP